jgi:hypothetical protein
VRPRVQTPAPAVPERSLASDPRLAALERALVEQVGPLGRMLMNTAVTELASSAQPADMNMLVERVTTQIPTADRRAAFASAARTILGS